MLQLKCDCAECVILKGRFGGEVEEVFLTITSASLVQIECLIAQQDSLNVS